MKKKYIILLFVIILGISAFFIANGLKKGKKTEEIKGTSYFSIMAHWCCLDERGLLFFGENDFLKFVDASSGEETFVCSNANCPHTRTGLTDVSCAAANAGATACLMSEDKIYILGNFKDVHAGFTSFGIYEEELDGTNLKKLLTVEHPDTVPSGIDEAELKDGKIWFKYQNTLDLSDEDNPVDLDFPLSGFCIYDIAKNKLYNVLAPESDDEDCQGSIINRVFMNGNRILYDVIFSYESGVKNGVYEYDIKTNTSQKLVDLDNKYIYALNENGFLFVEFRKENTEIYFYDMNEKKEVEIDAGIFNTAFSHGDKYFYCFWDNKDETRQWYSYEAGGEPVKVGDKTKDWFYGCAGDYVFLNLPEVEDGGHVAGRDVYRISVTDFSNGDFDKKQKFYRQEI